MLLLSPVEKKKIEKDVLDVKLKRHATKRKQKHIVSDLEKANLSLKNRCHQQYAYFLTGLQKSR
jgi:hypothetical protein